MDGKDSKERMEKIKFSMPKEVIEVETEDQFLAAIGATGPVQIQQKMSLEVKRENVVHALYDAKPPEMVQEEAEMLPLVEWSKVVARLDNTKQVKVDHKISAMALLGMFPVAREVEE